MESNCNKAHTNEPQQNTYTQSVTGIVIRDHKVLLARHTYGVGTAAEAAVKGGPHGLGVVGAG